MTKLVWGMNSLFCKVNGINLNAIIAFANDKAGKLSQDYAWKKKNIPLQSVSYEFTREHLFVSILAVEKFVTLKRWKIISSTAYNAYWATFLLNVFLGCLAGQLWNWNTLINKDFWSYSNMVHVPLKWDTWNNSKNVQFLLSSMHWIQRATS